MKALYLLNSDAYDRIYGPQERAELADMLDVLPVQLTAQEASRDRSALNDVEIILSGWGCPKLDAELLDAAPNLKAVFYGAGTIREVVTDAFWVRGIPITSSYAGNAVPVAEFTFAQIVLCLKHAWQYVFAIRREGRYPQQVRVPGAYGSTVGIVSLGMIGRMMCERLRSLDVHVIVYDPYVDGADAEALGVELCSLDEVFRRADVVSLHTPWLPETVGMITGAHFMMMKHGASFINTARGAVVREQEMIEALRQRQDLLAVLDVVYPEPPIAGSPLYSLDNVVLTPHIAGSKDDECRRMGRIVVEEAGRFVRGEPLRWSITREQARIMA